MFERLAEIDREYIKAKVKEGYYTSEIELVRAAIRKMREEDERQAHVESLRQLILKGHQQAENGEVVQYSDEFMQKAMENAVANQKLGKPIKDDVKP